MNKERLIEACDLQYWEQAEKQAKRSTLNTFKTGAVIFNHKTGEIVGKGCSHHRVGISSPTYHAEQHALHESYGIRNYGEDYTKAASLSIVIVTLGRTGNWACSSRPCYSCAQSLNGAVSFVHYAERMNNGEWTVNTESPLDLIGRGETSVRNSMYARDQRL